MDDRLSDDEMDQENCRRWNAAHKVHHPDALSGSDPIEVLEHHRVSHLIRPGLIVLDIGVGLGGMSRHLHACDCVVDALDAADLAEQVIHSYIRRFYLAEQISELPSLEYDLAVSQLVAQHMCERNLRDQIFHVGRSLRLEGIFSLHLAGATEGPLNNLPGPIPPGMDGAMCRDPDYAINMIYDVLPTGYAINVLPHRMEWPQFKSYWYFVHITRGAIP